MIIFFSVIISHEDRILLPLQLFHFYPFFVDCLETLFGTNKSELILEFNSVSSIIPFDSVLLLLGRFLSAATSRSLSVTTIKIA